MRRATARARARVGALAIALGLIAGCDTHPPPPIAPADLRLAREFGLFTVYWAGPSFHGIAVTAADSRRDYDATVGMRVYYGDCGKPSSILSTTGCQLPLEVATVLYHPHRNEGLGTRREAVIRGVPAEIYNNGSSIEMYTGRLAIDIYAGSPSLAQAAAAVVVPLNRSGTYAGNLPPPRFSAGVDPRVKALADHLTPPAPPARRPKRG